MNKGRHFSFIAGAIIVIAFSSFGSTALAQAKSASAKAKETELRCKELDRLIKRLDERARQALSGPAQDRITKERRDARSEQFQLRCR